MSKIIKGKWSPTLVLIMVTIILSATALLVPWWSVNISSEASSLLKFTMKTDYYIQQTVTAAITMNGDTVVNSSRYAPIVTNSTVSNFIFDPDRKSINLTVSGVAGTGFCNITIPRWLLDANLTEWTVIFDQRELTAQEYTVTQNTGYAFIYLNFTHPEHEIEIVGVRAETETQSISLGNLTENTEVLSLWLNVTYVASLGGLGLSCLMLVLVVLSSFGRDASRFLPFVGYIATVLLFIAPVLLAMNFPSAVSHFSTLSPVSVPPTWTPISPSQITGFWGNIKMQTSLNLPNWANGGNFWVWGPDAGWYLTFTASLLIGASSLLTRTIIKKKVEMK